MHKHQCGDSAEESVELDELRPLWRAAPQTGSICNRDVSSGTGAARQTWDLERVTHVVVVIPVLELFGARRKVSIEDSLEKERRGMADLGYAAVLEAAAAVLPQDKVYRIAPSHDCQGLR